MVFKLLVLCVVLLLPLVDQAQADGGGSSFQYRGRAKHPTLPEHCHYEELDLAIPANATRLPVGHEGFCHQFRCLEDYVLEDYLLEIRHCSRPSYDCKEGPFDYSLPYPDCCPKCL